MSMDRCKSCGELVDTDEYPEAYLLTLQSIGKQEYKKDYACFCSDCQENMIQNMTEEDWLRLQPQTK